MKQHTKWILAALLVFLTVFAVGCAKNDETSIKTGSVMQSKPTFAAIAAYDLDEGNYGEAEIARENIMPYPEPMPPEYDDHYGTGEGIDVELKIIRTAQISLEVEDYFLASQKAEAYAKKYGGYVSNSDARADQNSRHSGTVTLRIPEIHFDAVMAELSLLGEIQSKNVNGNDVTEEYIDLTARKDNAQAHEERLVAMYANATDVKQMMNIENEISRVREEIERYSGRLRYLENRVDMSTITVYMHEPQPVVKKWGVWESTKEALNNSLATLRWMIVLLGWLLPLIVLGIIIGFAVKMLRSARRKKRK